MMPLDQVRSALFVPASNARALAKARDLPCDMVILDLEDSVPDADKDTARDAVREAAGAGAFGLLAARINAVGSPWHEADVASLAHTDVDLVVVPKVEEPGAIGRLAARIGKHLLAMIETPAAIYAARDIAAVPGVVGLIVGPNDLAAALRLPTFADRSAMAFALQSILLAARAAGIAAFDGVYNRIDDAEGFAADCTIGRGLGFDAKTVIHPSQIEPANRIFGPTAEEVEDALAIVAAFGAGAERFRGRMIEGMHVDAAKRILARTQAR